MGESILSYDPGFFDEEKDKKIHNLELVQSVGIKFKGNLHAQYFNMFMMDLLRERAADLYRTKGVLSFHGQGDTKFVFQGVHEQINFGPSQKPWKEGEERENKFVFIGKNLDRKELTSSLLECLHKEDRFDYSLYITALLLQVLFDCFHGWLRKGLTDLSRRYVHEGDKFMRNKQLNAYVCSCQ